MALGKGLDALFLENRQAAGLPFSEGDDVRRVAIADVEPNTKQARQSFGEEGMEELAASIREHGVLSPLLTRKTAEGRYQIIAGERRWRAARMAGLREIPIIVLDVTRQKAMEISLIENLQRENLNPLEEAAGFQALIERFSLTQEQAAERVGKSRSAVTNTLRLLSLAPPLQQLLREGRLTAGHARALLPLPQEKQLALAEEIVAKGLNVRQAEQLAAHANDKKKARQEKAEHPYAIYFAELERKLTGKLGRRVRIDGRPDGESGRVTVEYYNAEDLEGILLLLGGGSLE